MKKFIFYFFIFFLVGFISCEKDDSDSRLIIEKLSGKIQKGPFITGTDISVQLLEENLVSTGISDNFTITNNYGGFLIERYIEAPYINVISRGFYFNEVTGKVTDTPILLQSLWKTDKSAATNVNILTTLTKNRIIHLIREGATYEEAKKQAQEEVLAFLNINYNENIDFNSLDISKKEEENAVLLAASCILQGNLSVTQLSELIDKISLDIKDNGRVDDKSIHDIIKENINHLNLIEIRKNLEKRYEYIDEYADIPPFEAYIEKSVHLEVTEIFPKDNDYFIYGIDTIKIQFNKAINQNSINNNIIISNAETQVDGKFQYDNKNRLIKFIPSGNFIFSEEYTIEIKKELKAVNGSSLTDNYTSTFKSYSVETTKGLVAFYPLDGNTEDASGNNFHATLFNGIYTKDIYGTENKACDISQDKSYILIPDVIDLNSPNLSISMWVNLNKIPENELQTILLSEKRANTGDLFENANVPLSFFGKSLVTASIETGISSPVYPFKEGNWYLFILIIKESEAYLYIDGKLTAKSNDTAPDSSGFFKNSKREGFMVSLQNADKNIPEWIHPFSGSIDNIRFYNRSLNPQEVYSLYSEKQ